MGAVINDKPFSTTPRHRRQPRHFSPNPSRWHPVLLSPSCPPMALPAARLTLCQRSSPRLSARISFRPSTPEWPRTRDSHTPSVRRLVTKPLLSPGELVVLLPVFPVSLEEEPTVLDRLLSVTCADLVAFRTNQGLEKVAPKDQPRTKAIRRCFCLGCFIRPSSPFGPWSPSFHRRSLEVSWRLRRRCQGQELPQAPRRKG